METVKTATHTMQITGATLGSQGGSDWRKLNRESAFCAAFTPQSVLGNTGRWALAAVIGQAVAAICIWGTLVGAMLPLVFRRLGVDPEYASSPFVATFVDVTGILIHFSITSAHLL